MVKAVATKEEFDSELKAAGDKPVVVDFHATWCGPCKIIAPFLEELATKHTDFVVLKIDVDVNEDVAQDCSIEAMPTFLVFKNGNEVDRLMGASKEKLEALFMKHK